eukprot:TRINITY_DN5986_c0_g1_i26.p1 TRINITY_DN5986_c0_g1~~TRINITY_DN5986_c0_g1_i26.p1  ORF type:complete len:361 (+),score=53.58 TRINITY_DN5986_c0_g1_i26:586-1668(+)
MREYVDKIMGLIYGAIEEGSDDVVNAWHPVFCIGIQLMDWDLFTNNFLPRILKMAGLESTYVNRSAAAKMLAAAASVAARKGLLQKLLRPYKELCLDSNVGIRKLALSNLRYIIENTKPSEMESVFLHELTEQLKDPNPSIRALVFELVVRFQDSLSTESIRKDVVGFLDAEFAAGWKDVDSWPLQHCGSVAKLLLKRGLLTKERVVSISEFFDLALTSNDMQLNLISISNIAPIAEINLWLNPDSTKYAKLIHDFALGPLYHQRILGILSELVRVHYEYKKVALVRPTLLALMQNEDQTFAVSLLACFAKMMGKILAKQEGDKETVDELFHKQLLKLSLIHICRCRRYAVCRSRWSPYH